MFPDRNLDTSQPSSSRDPTATFAQAGSCPGSASAHVCSGLLTHLTRHRQLLTTGPKRPPFPAKDPKSVPTALSQPVPARTHSQTVIPVCPSSMQGHFLASYFRVFDVVLHIFSLPSSLPSSHTSSHSILSPILFPFFSPSCHLSLQSLPFLKQDLLSPFPLQISTSAPAPHEHRAGKGMLERTESRRADRGSPEGRTLQGEVWG